MLRLKAQAGQADCPEVVFSLPKISKASSTKSALSAQMRSSGLFLFGVIGLGLATVGCGNRGDANGDGGGGGINNVGTGATSDSGDTRSTAGTGEGTTGNEIELPPDTGGTGGSGEGEACETFELDLKPEPTNLMLVIDKSGSMVQNKWDHDDDGDTPEVTRWLSLHGVVDQVTGKFDASVNFGAQIYPGQSAKTGMEASCAVSSMPEVAIQAGARDKILAAIPGAGAGSSEVKGATPTFAAYTSALAQLKAAEANPASTSKDRMPPAMVLITDGGANCSEIYFEEQAQIDAGVTADQCDPYRTDPNLAPEFGIKSHCINAWYGTYDQRIHGAIEGALTESKIKTYVIGIGIEDKETKYPNYPIANAHVKLNDLATKGGTARDDENTKYFSANNQDSLLSALDEIVASVVSCSVSLEKPIPEAQVPFVELEMKGKKLKLLRDADSCEGKDGWRWSGDPEPSSALELCGESCATLKIEGQLDVVVGCEPPA